MKITYALLATFILSAVQAYTPPADQADGAYTVTFDANGNPITKRHEMIRSNRRGRIPADVAATVERRDFPGQQIGCTQRNIDNHYDYSVVQNCLGTWLNQNSGLPANDGVYYCRSGDTLLAVCMYADTIAGSPGEIDNFNGVMDNTCGMWQSGWVFISDWNKSYWRTTWGESICDNAPGGNIQVYA